ncbi:hypothetical protein HK405_014427, partial [Cladochytrium tenue]
LAIAKDGLYLGKATFEDVVRESVVAYGGSAVAAYFSSPDPLVRDRLQRFVGLAAAAVQNLLDMYCFGRARQRRRLFKLVSQLESMQAESEAIDSEVQAHLSQTGQLAPAFEPFFLSSWVYDIKLSLMISSITMGIELNLFGAFEYPMQFWYLAHLYDMYLFHMDRLKQCMARTTAAAAAARTPPTPQQQRRKQGGGGGGGGARTDPRVAQIEAKELVLAARELFAKAMFKITCVLRRQGQIRGPDPDFYDEAVHFQHRFRRFALLGSPIPPEYAAFADAVAAEGEQDPALSLAAASQLLDDAQAHLATFEKVKAVLGRSVFVEQMDT